MDLARLTELESLFGRRYQALALLCLFQEGPMRWTAIARAMQRRADEHLHDKEITRSLRALETAGYIERVRSAEGTVLRALTPAGTRRAERLRDLIAELGV